MIGLIRRGDALTAKTKTEYQMVIEPPEYAREAGHRVRHYTYPKPSYDKAKQAVLDFLKQRESGRFEKTWTQNAIVYIESREVSKWQRLNMTDVIGDAATTSRPAS
jgi:hypothetical protein